VAEMRTAYKVLVGKTEGYSLEDIGIGRMIILEWILKK
jgi:hypothetical protein